MQSNKINSFINKKLKEISRNNQFRKINDVHQDIHRLEKIMIASTGFLMTTMLGIIVALILKLN